MTTRLVGGPKARVARRRIRRVAPRLAVDKMKTYRVASPPATHTRPGTCEEAGCRQFLRGWNVTLPVGSNKIEHLKQLMRGELDNIRRLDAQVQRDGTMVQVRFRPGTPCLRATAHRVPLHRPEFYVVRGGDWRANTGLITRHRNPDDWINDFGDTLDRARRVINGRG